MNQRILLATVAAAIFVAIEGLLLNVIAGWLSTPLSPYRGWIYALYGVSFLIVLALGIYIARAQTEGSTGRSFNIRQRAARRGTIDKSPIDVKAESAAVDQRATDGSSIKGSGIKINQK